MRRTNPLCIFAAVITATLCFLPNAQANWLQDGNSTTSATAPDLAYYNIYREDISAGRSVASQPDPPIGTSMDGAYTDDTAIPGTDYRYWCTAVDDAGNESEASPSDDPRVSTGAGDTPLLTTLQVQPNTPNPFNASTQLRFGVPTRADVTVEVFDVAGRRVAVEHVGGMDAGWHTMSFNGRDASGRSLPSGVYFYRVSAAGVSTTNKMVIQR